MVAGRVPGSAPWFRVPRGRVGPAASPLRCTPASSAGRAAQAGPTNPRRSLTRRSSAGGCPPKHGPVIPVPAGSGTPPAPAGPDRGRVWEVDAARGAAVAMMAVYHVVFDLATYGDLPVDAKGGGWRSFADATAALFLLVVGVSLTLSARRGGAGTGAFVRRQLRRGATIFAAGMLVTGATLAAAPEAPVRFGILHLIGGAVVLAAPFAPAPAAALPVGLAVVAAGPVLRGIRADFPWLLWLGVRPYPHAALDYRPLAPWFGVVLLGVVLGHALYGRRRSGSLAPGWGRSSALRPLLWLGRHSLAFYLLHQPLILAVLWALGVIDLRP